MKKQTRRWVAVCAAAATVCLTFSACGQNETQQAQSGSAGTGQYPMETSASLKYWVQLNSILAKQYKNMGETPYAQEMEKRTGVKMEYIHPAIGQEGEQFNLLLASGDMPDIVEYNWYGIPGGPEKALEDGYIQKLNPLLEQYAPNLTGYLKENPEIDRMVKTDSGNYYVFPFLRGDEKLNISVGPIIRKDWLDELGLENPETVDDWYSMLVKFRDVKGASAPLALGKSSIDKGFLVGAYGVSTKFYVDGGQVLYGPIQPAYKEFLTTLKTWYTEGLIDKNFAMLASNTVSSNMLNGKSGATLALLASGMGSWLNTMKEKEPAYDLVGVQYPTLNKGETPKITQRDFEYKGSGSAAITTNCKNPEIAARYLDFAYSEEGHKLCNFGIENLTYTMEEGQPIYTDEILNNPDGLYVSDAMSKYMRSYNEGPFVQDAGFADQYFPLPQQQSALQTWSNTEAKDYNLPLVTPKPEESAEMATIMNEINTYVDEMMLKFVMGEEPIDSFDSYVEQIRKMNIDRALQINQEALKRYYAR